MPRKKILVTGGTGFIGSHLVEKLIRNGYDVKCLVRKTSHIKFLKKLKVKLFMGDLREFNSLRKHIEDIDIIIHSAALLGKWGVPNKIYWDVNVNGTKNIAEAALMSNFKRLIHISTGGVVGPLKNPPADETFPYNPSNIYELTKAEAEKLVLTYYNNKGLPVTVIRPEFIYGPRSEHTVELLGIISRKIIPLVNGGLNTIHPTYIDDLISGILLIMEKKSSIGEIYNIGGPRIITMRQFFNAIAIALGISKKFVINFPKKILSIFAKIAELGGRYLNFNPLLTNSRVNFLSENRGSNINKAKEQLGYTPKINLEEGLNRTLKNDWIRWKLKLQKC